MDAGTEADAAFRNCPALKNILVGANLKDSTHHADSQYYMVGVTGNILILTKDYSFTVTQENTILRSDSTSLPGSWTSQYNNIRVVSYAELLGMARTALTDVPASVRDRLPAELTSAPEEPVVSTEPVLPTEPPEPTEPAEPTEPVIPTEPIEPAEVLAAANVPDSVAAKSCEIVGNESDDYTKVFLLHKWVAENIYYDYDALSGRSERITNSAGVLENRRSVCAGYSSLLRDLILAQGIPAIYSSNCARPSGSYALSEAACEDHAHTEAYVDGRWITMDATWDSNNEYRNGNYITEAPTGWYYFDISSEAFAMDHKIESRGGNQPVLPVQPEPEKETVSVRFSDVAENSYYAGPVAWALETGITTGTSAETFSPDSICTRAHIMTFLYRAFADKS